MAYSFDQAFVTLDFDITDQIFPFSSPDALDLIYDYAAANPNATEKDILEALHDDVTSNTPTISYADLYRYILAEISQLDAEGYLIPATGVDKSSWLWVRGAIDVNSNADTYFAQFIRDYTQKQYEIRYGEGSITPSNLEIKIQNASNDIALNLVDDILGNSQNHQNPNHELPSIDIIGRIDAAGAASQVFNGFEESGGNYSPWAGTILFPFLGQGAMPDGGISFLEQWVLQSGIVSNNNTDPETNNFKSLSGTYDLISIVAASKALFPENIEDFLQLVFGTADTIENNSIGEEATKT